jgi:CRISPR/Cas system CSM-associated protein Csm3 (group 7 of RAMP superfamily)
VTAGFDAYRGSTLFEATLEVVTPLHIGAGFDETEPRDGSETVEVAQVVIGANGLPAITATGLKGAMRALLKPEAACDLFGWIPGRGKGTAQMGVLVPYAALMLRPADLGRRSEPVRDADRGTFRSVRTAIDAAAGVPASNKLFSTEMVAPGARFALRLRLFGDPRHVPKERERWIAALLRRMRDEGLRLGRGRGDGQGLVMLRSLDAVTTRWVQGGEIRTGAALVEWRARLDGDREQQAQGRAEIFRANGSTTAFKLKGDVAFLIGGGAEMPAQDAAPAHGSESDGQPQATSRKNIILPLRRTDGRPELPGSSLMGALRARAEWIASLRRRRGMPGNSMDVVHIAELFGLRADQLRDDGLMRTLAERFDRQPIEITGLAGLLHVDRIEASQAETVRLASVRLDRFTQEPMDRALFSTEGFVEPVFTVHLRLRPHPNSDCGAELRRWVRRLLRHIALRGSVEQGLMLGHGRNRGFGWFTLERTP